jgi:hypothetical protein
MSAVVSGFDGIFTSTCNELLPATGTVLLFQTNKLQKTENTNTEMQITRL